MANYTSSLPDDILTKLSEMAQKLKVPKNQIIERALNLYLTEMERQLYIKSFKQLTKDEDIITLAEEGLEDYVAKLNEWDAEG